MFWKIIIIICTSSNIYFNWITDETSSIELTPATPMSYTLQNTTSFTIIYFSENYYLPVESVSSDINTKYSTSFLLDHNFNS